MLANEDKDYVVLQAAQRLAIQLPKMPGPEDA